MGRYATRTETATVQLMIQMEDFLKEDCISLTGFQKRYMPDTSYQMLRLAIQGADSTPELINTICDALDAAQRDQLRRDRKTCPHCKAALD